MFETTRVSSKVPTSFPGFSPTRPLGGNEVGKVLLYTFYE